MSSSIHYDIARVCHEANRAYCLSIGDTSQPHWDDAPDWQKDSAVEGVGAKLVNPAMTAADMHESWTKHKELDGWVYGPVKDAELKTHPCMVPYHDLPEDQQKKDSLFAAIVGALTPKAGVVS